MFCSCLKYSSFFKINIPPNKQAKRYFFHVLPNVLVLLTIISVIEPTSLLSSKLEILNLESQQKKEKNYSPSPCQNGHQDLSIAPSLGASLPLHLSLSEFSFRPLSCLLDCNNTPTLHKRITLLPSLLCAIIPPPHCFQSLLLTNRSKPLTPSLKFLSWQSHLFILQLQATYPVVDPAFLLTKCTSQDCCIHPFLNVMHVLMPLCFFLASGTVPSRKRNLNRGSLI